MSGPKGYKAVVVALMVGVMMSFIILAFSVLENTLGHVVAIASFAATTVSVFLNSRSPSNTPLVIFCSYMGAAVVGYGATLLPGPVAVQVGVAMFSLVFLFVATQWMHPPAVGYALTFLLGGYAFFEVLLTIPALFVYFITLGVVVLVVEQIARWVGWLPSEPKPAKVVTSYERIEEGVHQSVPYLLVVLFVLVSAEFLYPETTAQYSVYLRLLDGVIVAMFVVDLGFIYHRSRSLPQFFRQNWVDILATIPFFMVIRFFQGATLLVSLLARGATEAVAEVARFSRFARPLARTPRFARLLDRLDEVGL